MENGDFWNLEKLGTTVEPGCGSCRCGKCPVPGSRFSFKEESELKMIDKGLSYYDSEHQCWVAKYPYLYLRESLKGTREVAYRLMIATEKMLCRSRLMTCYRGA